MKRLSLVAALLLLIVIPQAMARGLQFDGFIQEGTQIGVNHVDPGEGGTDCSYLDETVYYQWVPIKEWQGGWLCEGTYRCKRGAAVLGLSSASAWAIPLPQAKAAAAAGFQAAVTSGLICHWVETLSCDSEDRYITIGRKRKYKEYVGEEYSPGRCRKRLDNVDWQEEYY